MHCCVICPKWRVQYMCIVLDAYHCSLWNCGNFRYSTAAYCQKDRFILECGCMLTARNSAIQPHETWNIVRAVCASCHLSHLVFFVLWELLYSIYIAVVWELYVAEKFSIASEERKRIHHTQQMRWAMGHVIRKWRICCIVWNWNKGWL